MTLTSLSYDKYLLYDELTSLIQHWAETYPDYIQVESVGQSYEGRSVWALTITNKKTGDPADKPALYIDGNIHAGEVTGSMAALHLAEMLLTSDDPKIVKLRDTRTFYIIPRVNPDGAELYLTTPTLLRSSVRPFPSYRKDEDPAGLHAEDIDNDGRILLMRIRDDQHGSWAISKEDPRMMVERSPLDLEGPFYHIYTEGYIKDENGNMPKQASYPFNVAPTKYGLDLNRNFPAGYNPLTPGSGPYPLSEPETRNQVEFITSHPNIGGALLYHTTGGVLFRPHSTIPDSKFAKDDLKMYQEIGDIGTKFTGYPVVCCYGDVWSGVLDDWCFEQLGLYAFTTELWDAVGRAAPEMKQDPMKQRSKKENHELELKLLQWNDRELAGKGFINWRPFEHPQLGTVEIGGWDTKTCRQNPPLKFLEQECHRISQFALGYALALPEVVIDSVTVEMLEQGIYSIEAVVSNHGFMDTNISQQAIKQQALRKDIVKLELNPPAKLINCQQQVDLGYLQGYAAGQKNRFYRFGNPAQSAKRLNWTIQLEDSSAPHTATLVLKSVRGGKKKKTVQIN